MNKIDTELNNLKINTIDYYICITRKKDKGTKKVANTFNNIIWFNTFHILNSTNKSINNYINFQTERVIEFIV